MRFTKMHGLGNDYIYVYGPVPDDIEDLSKRLSDRHKGIGGDGMIYISPSGCADFAMRIFNADGSEGAMCGNGIRCVGKYVYDKGYTDKKELRIETKSGIRTVRLATVLGRVTGASVDMGYAWPGEDMKLSLPCGEVSCVPVSVGNPHAVVFCEDADSVPMERDGKALSGHPAFPGGVNAEFVHVEGENRIRMRVWERGSGMTMACGTGACASAAAAVKKGYCRPGTPVTVVLDGGELEITVGDDRGVTMTGPAETVFEGETGT